MSTPRSITNSELAYRMEGQQQNKKSRGNCLFDFALFLSFAFVAFFSTLAEAQISKGQLDDFEDATTQGWQEGLNFPSPNEPTNVANGGPNGVGDNYLQNISAGFGAGGKMTNVNVQAQWTGDYISAGVKKVCADAKVEGTSDSALSLRVGFQTAALQRYVTLAPVVVPNDGDWYPIMLPINSSRLVPVSIPTPTYNQVMTNVNHFRIHNSTGAAFSGQEIAATMGLDNIRAWGASRDFDGDCKSDIVWHHQTSGQVNYWGMNGATINGISREDVVVDTNWQFVGTGDYDGDGIDDGMWRHTVTGQITYWRSDGDMVVARVTVGFEDDPDWKIVSSGDHDGDGKSDLLWHHQTTGQVYYWKMNGGTITSAMHVTTVIDTNWQVVANGDFNGDGKDDVLWRHATTGQVNYWQMNGADVDDNLYVDTVRPSLNWSIVGDGDYDGDGTDDVLWYRTTDGKVFCWEMQLGQVNFRKGVTVVNDLGWEIVGSGDHDGDGKADILWHYTQTGQPLSGKVNLWKMNGTEIDTISSVTLVSDLDWQIVNVD